MFQHHHHHSLSWIIMLLWSLILSLLQIQSSYAVRRPFIPSSHQQQRLYEYIANQTTSSTQQHGSSNNEFIRSLLGKNVQVEKPNSPDDHLVIELPLLDAADFHTKHWAGLLPASSDGDKYLFYWLFEPDVRDDDQIQEDDIPLLIWLNGGPACSSMDGLWLENGPFRLVKTDDSAKKWKIIISDHSWHTAPAYILYIDQPVGTGISFTTSGKYPRNDLQVNIDFYYFLLEFLKLHADKFMDSKRERMDRPLFFSGESHAGHYIPSMMNYIQQQNSKGDNIHIPLGGAAIGNGWVDPMYQYSAQDVAYGYGLIGKSQLRQLEKEEIQCRQLLAKGQYVNTVCFSLLDQVVSNSQGQNSNMVVSQYDQRKWEIKSKPRDFPPGHKDVEAYLGGHHGSISNSNYKDVLAAIHAMPSIEAGQSYYECTDPPYNALKHQDGLGVVTDVVAILNAGVRMLFFNGIHDLICNHVGNENAVENLPWKDRDDYQMSTRYGWMAPSTAKLGGYMKEYKNLQYLKVLDSGHMVPMDVPDVSLDMIRTFLYRGSFQSYLQDIDSITQEDSVHNKDTGIVSCPICPGCDISNNNNNNNNGNDDDNHDDQTTSCPICDDCNEICKEQSTTTNKDNVDGKVDIHPMSSGGEAVLYGIAAVTILTVLLMICWNIKCRRKKKKSGQHRPLDQYDMEMSATTMKTNGFRDNGGHSGYSDNDDEYGDEGDDEGAIRPVD